VILITVLLGIQISKVRAELVPVMSMMKGFAVSLHVVHLIVLVLTETNHLTIAVVTHVQTAI